ncbi:MAG: DNA-3-methyladenine glycosylase I [bacterium]
MTRAKASARRRKPSTPARTASRGARPSTPAKAASRCEWAGSDPLYVAYHDEEWGVPVRDDRKLFEFLVLEGAQAGLAWITILRKREHYRRVFEGFDAAKLARWPASKVERALKDDGIVRNRLKVQGVVRNARAFLGVVEREGSFARFLWSFVGGEPRQSRRAALRDIPPETEESRAMSRELRRRGFTFVGPTICYAFMQAVGMVNDHVVKCPRWKELGGGDGGRSGAGRAATVTRRTPPRHRPRPRSAR